MKRTLTVIGLATLLTVGVGYASFLTPGGSNSNPASWFNSTYISTNISTTTVKGSQGVLHTIVFDTVNPLSVITLYNSTGTATGTIIAQFTVPTSSPQINTETFDVFFSLGLVAQQTGNTSTFTVDAY